MLTLEYGEAHWGEYKGKEPDLNRSQRAAEKWMQEHAGNAADANGAGVQYSLVDLFTDEKRVIVDRDIFNGVAEKDKPSVLSHYLLGNLRGRLIRALDDGAAMALPTKNKDLRKLSRPGMPINKAQYSARLNVASHMDEVAAGSMYGYTEDNKKPETHRDRSQVDVRFTLVEVPIWNDQGKLVDSEVWLAEVSVPEDAQTGEKTAYDVKVKKDTHSDRVLDKLYNRADIDRASFASILPREFTVVNPDAYNLGKKHYSFEADEFASRENLSYNEVARRFQSRFSGRVACHWIVDLSNREKAAIGSALKTGHARLDAGGNRGGVNLFGYYYLFEVLQDGGVYVTDVVTAEELNIHNNVIGGVYDENGKDRTTGEADESRGGRSEHSPERISAGAEGRGDEPNDTVAGRESSGESGGNQSEIERIGERKFSVSPDDLTAEKQRKSFNGEYGEGGRADGAQPPKMRSGYRSLRSQLSPTR